MNRVGDYVTSDTGTAVLPLRGFASGWPAGPGNWGNRRLPPRCVHLNPTVRPALHSPIPRPPDSADVSAVLAAWRCSNPRWPKCRCPPSARAWSRLLVVSLCAPFDKKTPHWSLPQWRKSSGTLPDPHSSPSRTGHTGLRPRVPLSAGRHLAATRSPLPTMSPPVRKPRAACQPRTC